GSREVPAGDLDPTQPHGAGAGFAPEVAPRALDVTHGELARGAVVEVGELHGACSSLPVVQAALGRLRTRRARRRDRRAARACRTASVAAAPAISSGSVLRRARASTKAPSSEASIEKASARAQGRVSPASCKRWVAASTQLLKTSAHASRMGSLVLETSSATV